MRIAQKILRLEYIIQVNAGGLEIMGVVSDYEIVLGYFCHLISLKTFYSKTFPVSRLVRAAQPRDPHR